MAIIGTNDTATVRVASLPSGAAFDTAANVTFSPTGSLTSTNTQAAIAELDADVVSNTAKLSIANIAKANTLTALKALDTTIYTSAFLATGESGGLFVWKSGNYSTQITADTLGAIYVKADAVAASSGAWVRADFTGKNFLLRWFHDWTTTDLQPALAAAVALLTALEARSIALQNTYAARSIVFPNGDFTLSGQTIIGQGGIALMSEGMTNIRTTGTSEAIWFRHASYLDGQSLNHIHVQGLHFVRTSAVDGSDCYLRFSVCRHVRVENNKFENGTNHVIYDAAFEPVYHVKNIHWHNDSAKTAAYSVKVLSLLANSGAALGLVDADNGNTYIKSSQVWIAVNEMRSNVNDVQSHVIVQDIDGLQMYQNHVFNGKKQIELQPIIHGTGTSTNIRIENNFFDGGSDTTHNIYMPKLSGTSPLVERIVIQHNKLNDASTINVEIEETCDELDVIGNELDLCSGTSFIRTEGGGSYCNIADNKFRLDSSNAPSVACVDVFMTSVNQYRIMTITGNKFYENGTGTTFPARAILLTGNSTNACDIVIDGNIRDAGFTNLTTDNSGANVTVTTGVNYSY